jgi:hypothetical protein
LTCHNTGEGIVLLQQTGLNLNAFRLRFVCIRLRFRLRFRDSPANSPANSSLPSELPHLNYAVFEGRYTMDFFSRALFHEAVPPSPASGFLEKAIVYIPNRGRPRGASQSKRNARRCQKYAENQAQGVLEHAKQTLRQLPCMKTQNVCEMLGQMTNPDATIPTPSEIVTANVLRFTQAVARQHRCFVIRELFHGCDVTFLRRQGLESQAIRYARQAESHDEEHPFFSGNWNKNEREHFHSRS